MTIRDVERLMITREPVTLENRLCRIISFTMVWAPNGLEYTVDVMDSKGVRRRGRLTDLGYLDGRKSI